MVVCVLKKDMDSGKRVRSSNFSNTEMDVLLALVEEHKKVVGMYTYIFF